MDGNTETAAARGWQGQRQRGGGRRPVTMARRPRFLGMRSRIKARGQVMVTRCGEKMRFQGGREPHVESKRPVMTSGGKLRNRPVRLARLALEVALTDEGAQQQVFRMRTEIGVRAVRSR